MSIVKRLPSSTLTRGPGSRTRVTTINTVKKKITKFLEGLNPIIERDATGVVPPATFEEAVRRAYKFENLNNKILQIQGRTQTHQQNNQ